MKGMKLNLKLKTNDSQKQLFQQIMQSSTENSSQNENPNQNQSTPVQQIQNIGCTNSINTANVSSRDYQDYINEGNVGQFSVIRSNILTQTGQVYINQNTENQFLPSSINYNYYNIGDSQICKNYLNISAFQSNQSYQNQMQSNHMVQNFIQNKMLSIIPDMNKSIIELDDQNNQGYQQDFMMNQNYEQQQPQYNQQQQQQQQQYLQLSQPNNNHNNYINLNNFNNNNNNNAVNQSSNLLIGSKNAFNRFSMNMSRYLGQSKNLQSQLIQSQVLGTNQFCLIDSQIRIVQDAHSETVEDDNKEEIDDLNNFFEDVRPKSAQNLDEGRFDLNLLQSIQQPKMNQQQQPEPQQSRFFIQKEDNKKIKNASSDDDNEDDDDNDDDDSKKSKQPKVALVSKTIKAIRQKRGADNQYRQSKHKNVFKNFGTTLIRYIQYEPHFQERLKNEFFKDDQKQIKEFSDWLSFDAKLAKKTDFLRTWQTFVQDSEKIKEFKYILRELARDFFENFSLIYLMNTTKIANFEIHLRSIYTCLSALNNVENLEKFKPVPFACLV